MGFHPVRQQFAWTAIAFTLGRVSLVKKDKVCRMRQTFVSKGRALAINVVPLTHDLQRERNRYDDVIIGRGGR
jgi:hypothetical protein